jgi:thioredoxin reductase
MSSQKNDIRVNATLCIVGTGSAGLNALFVASRYLSANDKVVLIDRNKSPGGMWNDTYDCVRLHQPYPMFTAGNIPWEIAQPFEELASKRQVQEHFRHCLNVLRKRLSISSYEGCEYICHKEYEDRGINKVLVRCRLQERQTIYEVHCEKLIKAFGFGIVPNAPLKLSSASVRSICPEQTEFTSPEFSNSSKPVYVIGGGKTGTDIASRLLETSRKKKVYLIAGKGTVFINRNKAFPSGLRRWWDGHGMLELFSDTAGYFNGENEADTLAYFTKKYGIAIATDSGQFLFGFLSEEERKRLKKGIAETVLDYMMDVRDTPTGPEILFRSGRKEPVPSGTWIINCSGYLSRRSSEYEPYISNGGAVLSVQPSSAIHFLTNFSAYYLTHLFFLGLAKKIPLYEIDYSFLLRSDKLVLPFLAMSQMMYNVGLLARSVPQKVFLECGLDFDRWFPLYRRVGNVRLLRRNYPQMAVRWKQNMDRVRERFLFRCGPLDSLSAGH